jgi:hypothetical protein
LGKWYKYVIRVDDVMKINLPWSEMNEIEEKIWDKFFECSGYGMSDDELDILEKSYRRLTGDLSFEIRKIICVSQEQNEEQL